MIWLRKCFHGNIQSRRATEDFGWRSGRFLSWPIMDHYHRAPHTIYTKTDTKTRMAIQRAAESNTKTGRKGNYKHYHLHHHHRLSSFMWSSLYTHCHYRHEVICKDGEVLSLSFLPPLLLVSAFTLEDWKSMFTVV